MSGIVDEKHPLGSNILPFSEVTKLDRNTLLRLAKSALVRAWSPKKQLPEELWLYTFGFLKHDQQPAFFGYMILEGLFL